MHIQMNKELVTCILSCKGQKSTFNDFKEVFMYVKNYCSISQNAAVYANNMLSVKCIRVLDVLTGKYVLPTDLKQPQSVVPDTHLIQAYETLKKFASTVPQVFVLTSDGWRYIGGGSDFIEANSKTIETMFQGVKL